MSGIASIDPIPMHNSNKPNEASLRPMRAFAKGTSGAQAAMPNPAIKKANRVETCWLIPGCTACWCILVLMRYQIYY
ncbi:hypothetical protein YPPY103_1563 [Yersinia pestis PY-103]|nr:hypothetical protein YPPY103_1563 [Yersinia pestis PY-103]